MAWTNNPYCLLSDVKTMLDPNMGTQDDVWLQSLIGMAQANIDSEIGYAFQTDGSVITLRSAQTGNNGAGSTTLVLSTPTGTIAGDVLIAFVNVAVAGNNVTPPAGWTLIQRQDGATFSTLSYYHVAGSEPASYTWTFGSSGQAVGWLAGYIGVNNTTPVDVSLAQYNSSASTNAANNGVTTLRPNDRLLYAVALPSITPIVPPAGFSDIATAFSSSSQAVEVSQRLTATPGVTGAYTATTLLATPSVTHLIALAPAPTTVPAMRMYDGSEDTFLWIDNLLTLAQVQQIVFFSYLNNNTVWQNGTNTTQDITADIILKPNDYVSRGIPAHKLMRNSGLTFPAGTQNIVVSGVFGWPTTSDQIYQGVPNDISRATARLAVHYFKMRDTAYADIVQSQGGIREKYDKGWPKDVMETINNYQRTRFYTHSYW